MAHRRSPPHTLSPRPRGAGKKGSDRSVEELSVTLQEVEKSWQQEVRQRNEEEKRHKRELNNAKKLITKEVRSASSAVRKKEMEARRMEQRISHTDKQKEQVSQTKSRQVERYDQKLGQCEHRRNDFEDNLHGKMTDLGEAKGRLAHVKFAEQMLAKGMIVPIDGVARGQGMDHLMDDPNNQSFGDSQTYHDVASLEVENARLTQQNQELMHRLEIAERNLKELRDVTLRNGGPVVRQMSASQMVSTHHTPVQLSRQASPYSTTSAGGGVRLPSNMSAQSPRGGPDSPSQSVDQLAQAAQARLGQPTPIKAHPAQLGATPRLLGPGGQLAGYTPNHQFLSHSQPASSRLHSQPLSPGLLGGQPRPHSATRLQTPPPGSVQMGMPMNMAAPMPMATFAGVPASFAPMARADEFSVNVPSASSFRSGVQQHSAAAPVGMAAPGVAPLGFAPLGFSPGEAVFPGAFPGMVAGGVPAMAFGGGPPVGYGQPGPPMSGSPALSYFGGPAAANIVVEEVTTKVPYGNGNSQGTTGAQASRKRGSVTNDIFQQLDKNHDGVLSYDEFRAGLKGGVLHGV